LTKVKKKLLKLLCKWPCSRITIGKKLPGNANKLNYMVKLFKITPI